MSLRDRNASYRDLSQVLDLWWQAHALDVYTAMPGVVVEYDADTRRAKVRGVFDLQIEDSQGRKSTQPRAEIPDVPVVMPSTGRFLIQMPLQEGDHVLLVFSARPLSDWKTEFEDGPPARGVLHAEMDCMALPGFGPPPTDTTYAQPAETADRDGMVLQNTAGTVYISLQEDRIVTRTPVSGRTVRT